MRSIIVSVVALTAGLSWTQAQRDCNSIISSKAIDPDRSSRTPPLLPTSVLRCDCPDEQVEGSLAPSAATTVLSERSTFPETTTPSSVMPLLSSSLIAHTTAVSPRPPTRSAPLDVSVCVEFTLGDTRHRQDVEVKASNAKPKKVNFMAFNGRVVNNNGLGRVQCNVEINHGNYTYEAVPAFTVRFPVSFDRPQHVTGVKCYKV